MEEWLVPPGVPEEIQPDPEAERVAVAVQAWISAEGPKIAVAEEAVGAAAAAAREFHGDRVSSQLLAASALGWDDRWAALVTAATIQSRTNTSRPNAWYAIFSEDYLPFRRESPDRVPGASGLIVKLALQQVATRDLALTYVDYLSGAADDKLADNERRIIEDALYHACCQDTPDAVELNELAKSKDGFAWGGVHLAGLYCRRGEFHKARRELDDLELASQWPLDPRWQFTAGLIRRGLAEWPQATACFKNCADDADFPEAAAARAYLIESQLNASDELLRGGQRPEIDVEPWWREMYARIVRLLTSNLVCPSCGTACPPLGDPQSETVLCRKKSCRRKIAFPGSVLLSLYVRLVLRLENPNQAVRQVMGAGLARDWPASLQDALAALICEFGLPMSAELIGTVGDSALARLQPLTASRLLLRQGRLDRWQREFSDGLDGAGLDLAQADRHIRTGSTAKARLLLERKDRTEPLEADLANQLFVECELADGRGDAAVSRLNAPAALLWPRQVRERYVAEADFVLGDWRKSFARYAELLRADSTSPRTLLSFGWAALLSGQDDTAEECFVRTLKGERENVYAALGLVLARQTLPRQMAALQQKEPSIADLAAPLAKRLTQAGRHDLARMLGKLQ